MSFVDSRRCHKVNSASSANDDRRRDFLWHVYNNTYPHYSGYAHTRKHDTPTQIQSVFYCYCNVLVVAAYIMYLYAIIYKRTNGIKIGYIARRVVHNNNMTKYTWVYTYDLPTYFFFFFIGTYENYIRIHLDGLLRSLS